MFVNYGVPLNCEMYDLDHVRQTADEEVIALVDVLAHDINVVYYRYEGMTLKAINGVPIQNLKHLANAFNTLNQMESGPNKPKFIELSFRKDSTSANSRQVAILDAE